MFIIFENLITKKITGIHENSLLPAHVRNRQKTERKIKSIDVAWKVMLTLTYNNKNVESASGDDFRKFMNALKQFNRNRVKQYSKYKRWHAIRSYFEKRNKNLKYLKRVEFDSEGNREYNPHFHILIDADFYIARKKVQKIWGKGFCTMKRITNPTRAKEYVIKYIMKELPHPKWEGKTFSKSRNIKFPKIPKTSQLVGALEDDRYFELQKILLENPIDPRALPIIIEAEGNRKAAISLIIDNS